MDTGASFCIFQRLHAETVGIAVESGVPMRISTVTGAFLAYAHRVTLGVSGVEVESTVYFADDPAMPRDVLGQTGWLDRMRLGLVDHDRYLYLSHYDDPDGAAPLGDPMPLTLRISLVGSGLLPCR